MQRLSIDRRLLWVTALGIIAALAAVVVTTSRGQAPGTTPGGPVANGGAREWVAFDPISVDSPYLRANPVLTRQVYFVNTSNQGGGFRLSYEQQGRPSRTVCSGNYGPAGYVLCGVALPLSGGFLNGYLQLRTSQPVIPGGWVELPVQDWELQTGRSPRRRELNRGVVQKLAYDWQQGCPPKRGTSCAGSEGPPTATQG